MEDATQFERKVTGVSLIAAPTLLALVTFFWKGHEIGLTGGTLQVYSYVFWIPALIGTFRLLQEKLPRFAVLGSLLAIYACLGGNNFGVDGIYVAALEHLGFPERSPDAFLDAMGAAGPLVFFIPGIFFPLTLLALAGGLWRARITPTWVALMLALGAVAFPLSRIPRIQLLAHAADLLLLLPLVWLGWQLLRDPMPAARLVESPA